MARTGRPPIPLEVKMRDGKLRSRDRRASPVLVAGRGEPVKPPVWMTASQRAAFRVLAKSQASVLDAGDAPMVEAAAVLLARAREASAAVAPGLMVENRFGHLEPDPMLRVERDAWASFRAFAEQLGIGPSNRARLGALGVEGRRPEDEIDGLAEIVELRRAAQN